MALVVRVVIVLYVQSVIGERPDEQAMDALRPFTGILPRSAPQGTKTKGDKTGTLDIAILENVADTRFPEKGIRWFLQDSDGTDAPFVRGKLRLVPQYLQYNDSTTLASAIGSIKAEGKFDIVIGGGRYDTLKMMKPLNQLGIPNLQSSITDEDYRTFEEMGSTRSFYSFGMMTRFTLKLDPFFELLKTKYRGRPMPKLALVKGSERGNVLLQDRTCAAIERVATKLGFELRRKSAKETFFSVEDAKNLPHDVSVLFGCVSLQADSRAVLTNTLPGKHRGQFSAIGIMLKPSNNEADDLMEYVSYPSALHWTCGEGQDETGFNSYQIASATSGVALHAAAAQLPAEFTTSDIFSRRGMLLTALRRVKLDCSFGKVGFDKAQVIESRPATMIQYQRRQTGVTKVCVHTSNFQLIGEHHEDVDERKRRAFAISAVSLELILMLLPLWGTLYGHWHSDIRKHVARGNQLRL